MKTLIVALSLFLATSAAACDDDTIAMVENIVDAYAEAVETTSIWTPEHHVIFSQYLAWGDFLFDMIRCKDEAEWRANHVADVRESLQ